MTAGHTEPAGADYVAASTDTQFDGPCGSSRDERQVDGGSATRPEQAQAQARALGWLS